MPSNCTTWLQPCLFLALFCASAGILPKIDLPKDSPVALLSADYGDLKETARGGAVVLDFQVSLAAEFQRAAHPRHDAAGDGAGGHARRQGSVTISSLDVAPGDNFPVRIDLRLLRPVQA